VSGFGIISVLYIFEIEHLIRLQMIPFDGGMLWFKLRSAPAGDIWSKRR
jgi:hypothetical protein